jgi:hypothetical protein
MEGDLEENEERMEANILRMRSDFNVRVLVHSCPIYDLNTTRLSVALLQIDFVLQSTIGRTTAIATFILSGAGLVLSITFRLVINRPRDGKCPNRLIRVRSSTLFTTRQRH